MRLHEYEAKKIFLQAGISTPRGEKARSPKEAEEITRKIAQPVVVKAQVLVGGRGKAGGIRFAQSPEESGRIAEEMLGEKIKEEICQELLVEKRLSIAEELYAGITVDGTTGSPLVMFSREGGVEIEGKAIENPGEKKGESWIFSGDFRDTKPGNW
jgi:succinyl-CoA synthetase beta subunit